MHTIIRSVTLLIAFSVTYAIPDNTIEASKEPSNAITQCSPDDYPCQEAQLRAFSEQVPLMGVSFSDAWYLSPDDSLNDAAHDDEKNSFSSPTYAKRELPSDDYNSEGFAGSMDGSNKLIKQIPELNGMRNVHFTELDSNQDNKIHHSLLDLYDTESIVKRKVYNGLKPTFQMHLKDPQTGEIRGTSDENYDDVPIKYHGEFEESHTGITPFQLYIDEGEYGVETEEAKKGDAGHKKTDFLSRVWKADGTHSSENDSWTHSTVTEPAIIEATNTESRHESESSSTTAVTDMETGGFTDVDDNIKDFSENSKYNTTKGMASFKEKLSNFSSHLIKMHPVKVGPTSSKLYFLYEDSISTSSEKSTELPVTTSSTLSHSFSNENEMSTSRNGVPNVFNNIRSKLNINAVYANSTSSHSTHHTNSTSAHSSESKSTHKYANGGSTISPSFGWTIIAAYFISYYIL